MSDQTEVRDPEVRTQFNEARQAAELIPVGGAGVELQNFAQQVDYAKWIAQAGFMIPKHLRGNVGACLAVLDMSQRWGFSPFQVARMTYEVNGAVGLQAQLVHAVLNKFAPLQNRLRIEFEGEGDSRVCIVTGRFRNEVEDCVYRSPPFGQITPKNSPLWKTDPDQQQGYLSVTRWSRRFSPGTLMGIFTKEELEDAGAQFIGPDQAKDITPDPGAALHERLKASKPTNEGFRDGVVDAGLAENATSEVLPPAATPATPEAPKRTRGRPRRNSVPPQNEDKPAAEAPPVSPDSPSIGAAGGEIPATVDEAIEERMAQSSVPTTAAEYIAYAESWIDRETDPDNAEARYDGERDMRDELNVPIPERNRLVDLIRAKFKPSS